MKHEANRDLPEDRADCKNLEWHMETKMQLDSALVMQ